MRDAVLALLAIGLLGSGAAAEEIGIVTAVVQPQVQAFPPGKPPRDVATREPVERGMTVRLAKLTDKTPRIDIAFTPAFACGAKISRSLTGVLKAQGPTDLRLGDLERPCDSKLHVNLGKVWLALLQAIDVDTPDAVAGVKGTYLRVLVDPTVGTFVAVDEGVVTVQAKAGGDPVEVAAGQWVVVPPHGLPTRPARFSALDPLEDSPLQLRDFTTEPPGPPQ
jgi:hypothetical protein